MLTTIQYFALAGSLFFMIMVLLAVIKGKLKEAYALIWLLTAVLMVILSIWIDILSWISNIIGIVYPPATLFLIIICGILSLLFQYSMVISRNNDRLTRLTQEVALLKEELEKLKKQ